MNKYEEAISRLTDKSFRYIDINNVYVDLDTVKDLVVKYRDCKNELCLMCGKYKQEHEGSCNYCKYYQEEI